MPKDLILTYATDVKFDDLKRLLVSARRFCPPDEVDIAVFINPLGPKYHQLAEECDVELIPCNSVWKEIRNSKQMKLFYRLILALAERFERYPQIFGKSETSNYVYRTIAYPWLHAIGQRHLAYEAFLQVRSNYRMIFISDARDVILQGNPFRDLDETKLHVYELSTTYLNSSALKAKDTLDPDIYLDSEWVQQVFGNDVLDRLQGRFVACCGTTIGGREAIMDYLARMTKAILRYKYRPLDQAISNMILHLEIPPEEVVFHKNGEGSVLTLEGMDEKEIHLEDGEMRFNGRATAVVHMYDRMPETDAFVKELYPSGE